MKSLPNLLIVDDNPLHLLFLEAVLKKNNAKIIKAESGIEALKKTKEVELALAILDVQMPEMNGYELAIKINEERYGEKVPIIFLTASHASEIQVFKGYNSGAVDYIFKPVNNHILHCKVNVFLDLFNQKQTILRNAAQLKISANKLVKANAALKKSEGKYRSYVENAPYGVFVADETGRYVEVNEAACRMTGYSKSEFFKMSITDILPVESLEDGLALLEKLVKTGSSKSDLLFKHKNGTTRWWTLEAVKLTKTRFLGFTKDITDRKRAEEALEESQELFKSMVYNSSDLTILMDAKGVTTYCSPQCERVLGCTCKNFIGQMLPDIIHPEDVVRFDQAWERAFFQGLELREFEYRIVDDEGMVRWLSHTANLIKVDERVLGMQNTIRNITQRKHAEIELSRQREILQRMFDHIPLMIICFDKKGDVKMVNHELENKLGWTFEEWKTQNILAKCYPESGVYKEAIDFMIRNPIGWKDFKTTTRYGTIIDVTWTVILLPDGVLMGIGQDITKRKMAEQALQVSEKKYRTMLNASPDGILITDPKGIITDVSEIGLELYGSDNRGDLIGKHFLRFIPSDESSTIREIIEKTMNEGLAQNFEIKIRKKNQALFLSETSATLIQGPNGAPFSFMIIIRDISQRKKMEAKLIHADRMANLGEMASGIAHEINQPLNTISMIMDNIMVESTKADNIGKDYLNRKSDKIFENITRIRNIIDHVRAFSRSHDDYILTGFNINSSIKNAASMISEQLKYLAIKLDMKMEEDMPSIIGNTCKFEQVILNLLSNAKDALLEKKSMLSSDFDMFIEIRSFQENQCVIVEMTDNGTGISEEDIEYIMLPFYTTKDAGKGTGLGLSISYQIIKEMRGTIEITSNKFQGTTFKIILEIQEANSTNKRRGHHFA